MRYFFSFLVASALLFSCNRPLDNIDLMLDYYPMSKGHFVTYQVDSIIFSDAALPVVTSDTISFQLKEVIGDTFIDNSGRVNYKVERYRRSTENDPWVFDRVWLSLITDATLQRVEDNKRFIKLVFPPDVSDSWDGNAFISTNDQEYSYLRDWEYTYTDVDVPFSINDFEFEKTLTVLQVDEENKISKRFSKEHYSRNIGLVYREMMILEKQNVNNGWDQPERGVIVRYSIIDFSN